MTEDKLITLWCPEARVEGVSRNGNGNFNRLNNGEVPAAARCIGSACAAFREIGRLEGHDLNHHIKNYGPVEGPALWKMFCAANPIKTYCGKYGKPE